MRSTSSARSPLVGPAGPRTRTSQARGTCESLGRKASDVALYRPPVLRL
jgi:hypothetical protein